MSNHTHLGHAARASRAHGLPIRRPRAVVALGWDSLKRHLAGETYGQIALDRGQHMRSIVRQAHTATATLAGQAARRRATVCVKTSDGEICRGAIAVYATGLDTDDA